MPKKHIAASASADAAPPLPARLSELLAALPMIARVENSKGEILAHNRSRTADIKGRACSPSAPQIATNKHGGFGEAALPVLTTYPLPPIKGCPPHLRLVTIVSNEHEADCHARVISALLALLLDVQRPDNLQLTPQQRAIRDKLSQGINPKEAAYELNISYDTLRTQLVRMRKQHGDGIIPRARRRGIATKSKSSTRHRVVH